jgi:hypothetical protein
MRVTFKCGHTWPVNERQSETPVCPCGEHRIIRSTATAPRIRGVARGPHVTTVALEPITVAIGTQTLKLKALEPKEQEHGR